MAKKIIVIFVEGQSEEAFYSKLCNTIQKDKGSSNKIIIKNLKGIGNYESKAFSKLKNEIIPKYKNASFEVFCSYDTDVFDFPYQEKPPVDWKKVEDKISSLGYQLKHIKVNKAIEDWFLIDLEGLCLFLNIKKQSKLKGKNGYQKIKNLFSSANKIYQKGYNVGGFVDKLDFKIICDALKDDVKELIECM
jgi:hypothetical protein